MSWFYLMSAFTSQYKYYTTAAVYIHIGYLQSAYRSGIRRQQLLKFWLYTAGAGSRWPCRTDITRFVGDIWHRWPRDSDPTSSGVLRHSWACTGLVYVIPQWLLGVRSFGVDSIATNSAAILCTAGPIPLLALHGRHHRPYPGASATSSPLCWRHTGVWFLRPDQTSGLCQQITA